MNGSEPRLRLKVVVALLILGVIGGSLALSRYTRIRTDPGPDRARSVVLFTVPGLSLDDLDTEVLPNLDRMAERGSIAVANIRTEADQPNLVGAYATLGAGNRTGGSNADVVAFPADASWGSTTIRAVVERRLGRSVEGDILLPLLDPVIDAVRPEGGSGPGALGDALAAAGKTTAVVSNASPGPNPAPGRSAPAALAVSTADGIIGTGSVGDELLTTSTAADGTERVVADIDAYVAAVVRAQMTADVVVVDSGDTTRAMAEGQPDANLTPAGEGPPPSTTTTSMPAEPAPDAPDADALRVQALQRTDRLLGALRTKLRPGTLLLVVGVTPSGRSWALTPVVAVGPGVPAGYLESTSTHRPALVTLTDVAPTVLDRLGVDVPAGMIGQPMRYRSSDASWSEARRLDDLLESRASADRVMTITFIGVQGFVYGLAFLFLFRRRNVPRRLQGPMEVVALACGAWPAATFLLRIGTSLYSMGMVTFALSWVVAFAVALAARRLRGHPLDPVIAISALTVATIVADLATGAHLQVGSFFGYTPHTAPRFVGLGNSGFAILAGSTVALATGLVARSRDRATAWWLSVGIVVLVVVADGAPWMGADVGGILALVPVLALMLWALRGNRIRWSTLVVAVLGGLAVLGLAVGFEALRAPSDRTHIGRFFLGAGDGNDLFDTLRRKWNANTRTLRESLLTWLIPILAVVGIYSGRRSPAVRRSLPPGSPQRIGVVATLAVGTAGWLVNDSGIIVAALACVQLGPYLLLLTFRGASSPEPTDHVPTPVGDGEATVPSAPSDTLGAHMSVTSASAEADPRSRPSEVVALVPAKDRADSVADTVRALLAVPRVDRVLVIDDGSTDDTAAQAAAAGADVLRLPDNLGKGGAVLAGVDHTPEADVYLLIDADLARTAAAAERLLGPVLADEADLTIGVLPPAEGRGGFGAIKKLAAKGIERACGLKVQAPLSGQRAIRAELLRGLFAAERFGLEVAMTIDVARAGGRVLEVEVPMDHRHTGRSLSGFSHRGGQGVDIVRSLWPRVTTGGQRIALFTVIAILVMGLAVISGSRQIPDSQPGGTGARKVLIFGMTPFSWDDLDQGVTPNLEALAERGAIGATSVRTVSRRPTPWEGYMAIGSGARLQVGSSAAQVIPADTPVGEVDAAQYVTSLTGHAPTGTLVAVGGPAVVRANGGPAAASQPGFLADTLQAAGMAASFVGVNDHPATLNGEALVSRPAALAVIGSDLSTHRGVVDGLLMSDPESPYGVRADPDAVAAAVKTELAASELVVVDPGDLTRAYDYRPRVLDSAREAQWNRALKDTDAILGRILDGLDADTLVLVVPLVPSEGWFHLPPMVVAGPGVPAGTLQSASTQREGLVAITDLAPTVLAALGIDKPIDIPGNALRYSPGRADRGAMRTIDADTDVRERTYYGNSWNFILAHLFIYGAALLVVGQRSRFKTWGRAFSFLALTLASYPAATFLVRLIPGLTTAFLMAQTVVSLVIALGLGYFALRRRGHPLASIGWVAGFTTATIVVDTWIGTPMQMSSWLGSSMHNAGRFYGIPNSTFAVLGACSILWGAIHIDRSPRRSEAVFAVGCVFAVTLLSAGLPMLGADVGTLMTLFPIYALLLVYLSGHRIRVRTAALAGAGMVSLVVVAAGLDLTRAEQNRSHLGRFAQRFLDEGPAALLDTFNRKQSANLRILSVSVWSDLIPILAIFLLFVLVWDRRWTDLLPRGGVMRAGFLGVIAAAVLGFATNDSGPIVVSLFLCFLAPLILIAVVADRVDRTPQMIPAGSGIDPPSDP